MREGDLGVMEEATDNNAPRYQVSIAGVLLMLTGVAVLMTLIKYADTILLQMLFALVILFSMPMSWLIERINSNPQKTSSLPDIVLLKRWVAILACCIVSMLACYLAMWIYDWPGIPSKMPPALFILLSQGVSVLASMPFSHVSLEFVNHAYLAVPACGLIYFCLPILRNRENTNLPIRSTTILVIYSVTNICWFAVMTTDFAASQSSINLSRIIINIELLFLLWGTWLWRRCRFSTSTVILWNLTLVVWLFYFSHPFI